MTTIIAMDLSRPQLDLLEAVFDDWAESVSYCERNPDEREPEQRKDDAHDMACVNAMSEQFPDDPGIAVFSGERALECLDDVIQWLLRLWWHTKNEWDRDELAEHYQSTPETAAALVAEYDKRNRGTDQ